jgi:Zn-dependent protease with chaperone function
LMIALGLTIAFNIAAFFISPWFMDLTQQWLYGTRWISMPELERLSPESALMIKRVCAEHQFKQPRLGLIEDQNPTAFTYGSLPDTARLVVSRGLFTYLDDDEIATVYAHELGHIAHWDFAVMTLASTLVQITYLIYVFANRLGRGGDSKIKDGARTAALAAYVFYIVGTYLLLFLSRTREYFADHFAAEKTGNPNALSRALVKIAYGIVEEGKRAKEPSRLIEGTRALGIYDAKAAASTGTAYRIASSPEKIGRVFLWDLFNPWGWWMELNSTHPLTGKRVRALSTYAEQLGLETEFDMGRVVGVGRTLSKSKLYGHFFLDLLLYSAETLGLLGGLLLGIMLTASTTQIGGLLVFPLIGYGVGTLTKAIVMYPNFNQATPTDILTLMSDPYASPLRGQAVKLAGELIGRGDSGYRLGSDLKLQDQTGMIFIRYASRFGAIGNFLFGMKRVQALIGTQGTTIGWFRRGMMPWMDLVQFTSGSGTVIKSYHRFWSLLMGWGAIILGIIFLPGVLQP